MVKKITLTHTVVSSGPCSVVGIATGYGLDSPGNESRWGRDFPLLWRDADPSPPLVPWSRKSRALPLLPLWAVRPVQSLSAHIRVHFIWLYLEAVLNS